MPTFSQIWPVGAPSRCLGFLDTCPSVFERFLAFWHKIFQANVVLSLFQLCSRLFLQEPWFLRSQDLRAKCAQSYWRVTALRPSQWAGYICTHVCLYTHLGLLWFLSLSIEKHEFLAVSLALFQFSLSVFVTSFSPREKSGSRCPLHIYSLFSPRVGSPHPVWVLAPCARPSPSLLWTSFSPCSGSTPQTASHPGVGTPFVNAPLSPCSDAPAHFALHWDPLLSQHGPSHGAAGLHQPGQTTPPPRAPCPRRPAPPTDVLLIAFGLLLLTLGAP